MAPWGIILIAAAAAVFLFVIVPALLIFIAVFYHKKAIPFEQYDLKKYQNHYYIPFLSRIAAARKWIQSKPHTRVWQSSYDGLQLLGDYYDRGAARTAILFHGIGAEMYTNVSAHARFLYQCGFNVLITCQRAHGESGGRWTTIGLREQHDVLSWTRRAEELGAEEILLYGVSMGAASVAYASDKLRLHQHAPVCNCRRDKGQMIRRYERLRLPESCLGYGRIVALVCQIEPALIIVQIAWEFFSEEQLLRGLCKLRCSETKPDRSERTVAAVGKCVSKVLLAMCRPVIAVYDVIIDHILSLAVERKAVCRAVLLHVGEGCDDLVGGSGRIESLRCPIYELASGRIRYDRFPVCSDRVRIEIRLADHGKNRTQMRVKHDHCSLILTECVVGSLLQVRIQCGNDRVSGVLNALEFIYDPVQEVIVRCQEIIVHDRFDAALSVRGITDRVGEHIGIRIDSDLLSIGVDLCRGEHVVL